MSYNNIKIAPRKDLGFYCEHSATKTYKNQLTNCKDCGIIVPSNSSIQAFKSSKQTFGVQFNPHNFYKSICKQRLEPFTLKLNPYTRSRRQIIDWTFDLAERLKLTLKTIHLGIYMLDYCVDKDQSLNKQLQLNATVALFISAKAIEKDERIPFIPTLRSKSVPIYMPDEFKRAEHKMIQILNFNVQLPTILDFTDFYASQGMLFSDDVVNGQPLCESSLTNSSELLSNTPEKDSKIEIEETRQKFQFNLNLKTNVNQNNEKIRNMVLRMEKELRRLSNAVLNDENYLEYSPKILAASCIAFIRKMHNIQTQWHPELEKYSQVSSGDMQTCLQQFLTQYEAAFKQNFSPQSSNKKQLKSNDSPSTTTSSLTPKSTTSPFGNPAKVCFQQSQQSKLQNNQSNQQFKFLSNNPSCSNLVKNNNNIQNFQKVGNFEVNENNLNARYSAYSNQIYNNNNISQNFNNNISKRQSTTVNLVSQSQQQYQNYDFTDFVGKQQQQSQVINTMQNRYRKPSYNNDNSNKNNNNIITSGGFNTTTNKQQQSYSILQNNINNNNNCNNPLTFHRQTSLTLKHL